MSTIGSSTSKPDATPKDTKSAPKASPKMMTPKEEQAFIDSAVVNFSKPLKNDPELANMASPAERAALQSVLGVPKEKSVPKK